MNKEEKRLEFSQGPSSTKYFYVGDIKQVAYQVALDVIKFDWGKAVKEKKTEVLIPDVYEEKGISATAYGVVDLKNQRMYAIKFELKTTSSSATEYFLLPLLE